MSTETQRRFLERIEHAFQEGDAEVRHKSTETAHVKLIQEMYCDLIQGNFEGAFQVLDDDVELEITGPPALPFRGRWQGRGLVIKTILDNFSSIEEQQPEIHHVVAQGDTVIVIAREQGRLKATGSPYDIHWVQLFTFRDGKTVRIREIVDGYSLT